MARLRYVKSAEQLEAAAKATPAFLNSTVRSIRAVYETDPALVAAVLPRPLEPVARPEVCVTFSHVTIHLAPELEIEIGSAIFGVRAAYDGVTGIYLITMPMTTEQAVTGGRETYGEPKKIAKIEFERQDERVRAKVSRMGIDYLEASGRLGTARGPRQLVEHAWCYKALPSCEPGKAFDHDPLLVRLEWRHDQTNHWDFHGELRLGESPFDPVADLPLRRLVSMQYEEGRTESNGTVLRPVPGAWLLPFLHQRYDDPTAAGIEVAHSVDSA